MTINGANLLATLPIRFIPPKITIDTTIEIQIPIIKSLIN